jgi:hypothetical protein
MINKNSRDIDPFSTIKDETITETNEKNKQIKLNGRINNNWDGHILTSSNPTIQERLNQENKKD